MASPDSEAHVAKSPHPDPSQENHPATLVQHAPDSKKVTVTLALEAHQHQ
jgi:hypothetical protein